MGHSDLIDRYFCKICDLPATDLDPASKTLVEVWHSFGVTMNSLRNCFSSFQPLPKMSLLRPFLILATCIALPSCAQVATSPAAKIDTNPAILAALKSMPPGGGYEASQAAVDRLAASVTLKSGIIHQDTKACGKSFCSGATYLVFLRVLNQLKLPENKLTRYANLGVQDGEEIFGRWNANGPGTAKLFTDLECGVNFTSYSHAQPGDFLKMWWTDAIGAKERGHLVVYLSQTPTTVTSWSANQPNGYGKKTTPKSKIKHHLFSRLTTPQNLIKANTLSKKDPFLANMLTKDFTWPQIKKACQVRPTP
jgi:hypothetical protein